MIIILTGYFYKGDYFTPFVVSERFGRCLRRAGRHRGEAADLDNVPGYVSGVLRTLSENGFEAYLVGGCLRDTLLGRPVNDWDVASSARGPDVMRLFPKTVKTGARFGTITVVAGEGTVEVTTFRSDGHYGDCRRPDSVTFVTSLEEDLRRRDFTVNAMALAEDGVLIDPFGGREDLDRRMIRCVGNPDARFSEDALRLFRALRFSAQMGFRIEENTMAAIRRCAPLCAALSAERVRDETEKMLLSDAPERVGTAVALGLYQGLLRTGEIPPDKLGRLTRLPKDAAQRWCAFCALLLDAGLIDSPEDFLKRMRLDGKTSRACAAGLKAAARPLPADRIGLKRLIAGLGRAAALCAAAADKALYDTARSKRYKAF
jgi:tRNA nucleotidyltransferase (CCA-adding enzyme)